MSGVYYHIVAFACEKDVSAGPAQPGMARPFCPPPLADRASALDCCKAPLLGVCEPSHGYSQCVLRVKRLLLAALAKKTNRGRGAHKERE